MNAVALRPAAADLIADIRAHNAQKASVPRRPTKMALQMHPTTAAAESFMAIGGRLMINPRGQFIPAIDAARVLSYQEGAEERCEIARKFDVATRERGSTLRLKNLVARRGHPCNGWLVLDASTRPEPVAC